MNSGGTAIAMMFVVTGIYLFGISFFLIPHLLRTDRFYRRIYEEHPELWIKIGKPCGWMRWNSNAALLAARPDLHDAPQTISFEWYWSKDPAWLDQYPDLRKDYYEFRRGQRVWNFVLMPIFGVLFLTCLVVGLLVS